MDLHDITRIELDYVKLPDSPETRTLGKAYRLLKQRWLEGHKDRETALRLMFLAWYSCAEPNTYTGLPDPDEEDTASIFREVFTHLGGEASEDAEVLYAVGLMAHLFPDCIGPENEWKEIAKRCFQKAHSFRPAGFHPSDFSGRGYYGEYFAHQVRDGTYFGS